MIYEIIIYFILFIATAYIIVSCAKGTKRNKSNKKLEDRIDNFK
jgi:hypothetical protein